MKKVIIIIIAILILCPILITTRGQEHIIAGIGASIAIAMLAYAPLVKLLAPHPEVLNDDDYEVNFSEDKVYIKYNGREFCTEIKNIRTNSKKLLKDQYGKKISQTLNFQIMNDVRNKYNELIKQKIKGKSALNKVDVISKFKGIRLANQNEKEEYVKYLKKTEKHFNNTLNFFILVAIISMILIKDFLFWICMLIGLIIVGFIKMNLIECSEVISHERLNGNLYIANCYAYEVITRKKNTGRHSHIIEYYIKVTDNESSYLEEEFKVDYKSVNTNNDIKAFLYVIEDNGKYDLDVCTESMLNS